MLDAHGGTLALWRAEIFSGRVSELRFDLCGVLLRRLQTSHPTMATELHETIELRVYSVATDFWRLHVTCALMAPWTTRLAVANDRRVFNPTALTTQVRRAQLYLATLQLRPREGTAGSDVIVARALCDMLHAGGLVSDVPRWGPPSSCHVLLFDGGSRGNPGAGGYGAVIVRVAPTHRPTIVWAQAGFLASSKTTNNTAELEGVARGLRRLRMLRPHQVVVIGDSRIVLDAMRCTARSTTLRCATATRVRARTAAAWLVPSPSTP